MIESRKSAIYKTLLYTLRLLISIRTKMMATELNISVGLVDVTRKAPGLVSSGEILWERVQLTGLVVIHPLWLLLHWLWSVRLMDLRLRD